LANLAEEKDLFTHLISSGYTSKKVSQIGEMYIIHHDSWKNWDKNKSSLNGE
jgi:RNA-binding protein YhbY